MTLSNGIVPDPSRHAKSGFGVYSEASEKSVSDIKVRNVPYYGIEEMTFFVLEDLVNQLGISRWTRSAVFVLVVPLNLKLDCIQKLLFIEIHGFEF